MKIKNDIKKYWPHIIIGVSLLTLLILFGVFDLAIAKSFDTYKNWFSIGFDMWGKQAVVIPIGVTIIFASISAPTIFKKKNNLLIYSIIGFVISMLGTIIFHAIKYDNFINENSTLEERITVIATSITLSITLLSLIATVVLINKLKIFKDDIFISTLWIRVVYAIAFLIITTLIVTVFKEIWGRPRPNSVINNASEFKYLFEINFSSNRGKSFPSGHTQAAGMFFLLIYFIPKSSKQKILVTLFLIISICSMLLTGMSRVVYHKHFPSDVTFATILVIVCFVYGPKLINLIIKK